MRYFERLRRVGLSSSRLASVVAAVLVAPIAVQLVFVVVPGFGSYVVLSGSMSPAVPSGALVYTYDTDNYAPGDVVTFSNGEGRVTHRIVRTTANGFVTKGDANEQPDPNPITEDCIQGEVLFSVPAYGYVLRMVASHGLALALVCAGVSITYLGVGVLLSSADR